MLFFSNINLTAPSTSGPPSYSTEEIIGTSTSTSIEVKPPQSTEQTFASSNVYLQNTSMPSGPSGAVTEPSVFEYNATYTSPPPLFDSNTTHGSDFFASSTPAMPQLEGVDYRQSKFFFCFDNKHCIIECITIDNCCKRCNHKTHLLLRKPDKQEYVDG